MFGDGKFLGMEMYKIVRGRGFVNVRKLDAEAGAKQVAFHLRQAIQQSERTQKNIEMLPEETQEKLRELDIILRALSHEVSGIPIGTD